MAQSWVADIDRIIKLNDERATAIVRATMQDMVNGASLAILKGGRMRVDTGFLRASGKMSLTGVPTGAVRGAEGRKYSLRDSTVIASLMNFKLGNTIYYGWTANYAEYREYKDRFMEVEIQNFQAYADKHARRILRGGRII